MVSATDAFKRLRDLVWSIKAKISVLAQSATRRITPAIAKIRYAPLTIRETEVAIKEVKDFFERALAKSLHLTRVSAPQNHSCNC